MDETCLKKPICLKFLLPLVAAISFYLSPLLTLAESGRSSQKISFELSQLQFKIGKESDRLKGLQEEVSKLQGQLDKVKAERAKATDKLVKAKQESIKIENDLEKLDKSVADMESVVDKRRKLFEERLISLYKTSQRAAHVDFLANAESLTKLLKHQHFMKLIAKRDLDYIEELSELIIELEDERQRQRAMRRQAEESLQSIKLLEDELKNQELRQASFVKDVRRREQSQKKVLLKLKSKAKELEKMVSELIDVRTQEVKTQTASIKTAKPDSSQIPEITESFEGRGLLRLKGKLPIPVDGDLIRTYGRHHHEEFSDIVFSKGLEFKVDDSDTVSSVADGKVILSQQLPGYGNVVIVDHGKRYYTLYGRLKNMLVQVGDIVRQGDTVGALGGLDSKGRNFYFELRVRGKAINPTPYFRDRLKVKKA